MRKKQMIKIHLIQKNT